MIRCALVGIVITSVLAGAAAQSDRAAQDRQRTSAELVGALQPLRFLLGVWTAAPGPAGETGGFSFSSDVQGHVIVRSNFAEYPAAGGKPASRHDDLLVIAAESGIVRATYYDNEGHQIRYVVTSPRPGEALFVSEPVASEPRFRLRYVAAGDAGVNGEFDIAPPGQPDAFSRYLSWTARRSR